MTTQTIHDILVKKFNFRSNEYIKPMYLCGLFILSTKNEHIVDEYYVKQIDHDDEIQDKEFKDRRLGYVKELVQNAQDYIDRGFVEVKPLLDEFKTKFDNILKFGRCDGLDGSETLRLGRLIYKESQEKTNTIGNLFEQFFKYVSNGKEEMKNSEWTPGHIADIMGKLTEMYKFPKKVKILEPCVGANNLIHALRFKDYSVTGFEVNEMLSEVSTIDNIVHDTLGKIYLEDFIKSNKIENTIFDFCIANPPFTKNISGYEAIEFVFKAMLHSNHGVFIFPASQINTDKPSTEISLELLEHYEEVLKGEKFEAKNEKLNGFIKKCKDIEAYKGLLKKIKREDFRDALFNMCHIDYVITLGDGKVFDNGNAGEIVIVALSKKGLEPFKETRFKEILMNKENVKAAVKQKRKNFTPEGQMLVDTLFTEFKTLNIEFGKSWLCKPKTFYDYCKESLTNEKMRLKVFEDYPKKLNDLDEILKSKVSEDIKAVRCIKLVYESQLQVEVFNDLRKKFVPEILTGNFNIHKYIDNLCPEITDADETKFEKVKLMKIFEKVKGKSLKIGDCKEFSEENIYPVIGASKINNGIVAYSNNYTFEASEEKPLYTIAKNGTVGTMFRQTECFNISTDVYTLKPLIELNKINTIILTTQLTNMGFGFSNKINETILNDIEVYIYKD